MPIILKPVDEVYMKVETDEEGVIQQLYDHFTYRAPGFQFHPRFKQKRWDGNLHLFNPFHKLLYRGLWKNVLEFAAARGIQVIGAPIALPIDEESVKVYARSIMSPDYNERDYQMDTFIHCVKNRRVLILSPTASGKSLLIYLLARYYREMTGKPSIIITNRSNLVKQINTDFEDYTTTPFESTLWTPSLGYDISGNDYVFTTWQSASKNPKWLDQFGCIIGDEAHNFKAKTLVEMMEATTSVKYKFGLTGTLDGTKVNELVLQGLFGPVYSAATTKELIDAGYLADLSVVVVVLKYPEIVRQQLQEARKIRKKIAKAKGKKTNEYDMEMAFIEQNAKRNQFLVDFMGHYDKENTLMMFRKIERHGDVLAEMMRERYGDDFQYIHGATTSNSREKIRKSVDERTGLKILASIGTFAEGANMKNLRRIIMATPMKGKIKLMQSIGRGLRLAEGKDGCTFFDIADDLRYKSYENYGFGHLQERIKAYDAEGFKVKFVEYEL